MEEISAFDAQLERIRDKLPQVEKAGPKLARFADDAHGYRLGPPTSLDEIRAFETRFGVSLPPDFVAFLNRIGNGGAGPDYGLPLFDREAEFIEDYMIGRMAGPCVLTPDLDETGWRARLAQALDTSKPNEARDADYRALYAGVLPYIHQGCGIYSALVLNGPFAGRIVVIDGDETLPVFAQDLSFLDYYERWQDEVIAGNHFGAYPTGDAAAVLDLFDRAEEEDARRDALRGLFKFVRLTDSAAERVEALLEAPDAEIADLAETLLLHLAPERARPRIEARWDREEGAFEKTLKELYLQELRASGRYLAYVPAISARLDRLKDPQDFLHACVLISAAGLDALAAVEPFVRHPDSSIRTYAMVRLSEAAERHPGRQERFLETFLAELMDENGAMTDRAMRGVVGLKDARLLDAFETVRRRFEGYGPKGPLRFQAERSLAALDARLAEWGYSSRKAFAQDYARRKGQARRPFWKFWAR